MVFGKAALEGLQELRQMLLKAGEKGGTSYIVAEI